MLRSRFRMVSMVSVSARISHIWGGNGLKQAKQLTAGKCSKDAGFPLTR